MMISKIYGSKGYLSKLVFSFGGFVNKDYWWGKFYKIGMVDKVHCCYDSDVQEIREHIFISCPATQMLWVGYENVVGIQDPFIQLQ